MYVSDRNHIMCCTNNLTDTKNRVVHGVHNSLMQASALIRVHRIAGVDFETKGVRAGILARSGERSEIPVQGVRL